VVLEGIFETPLVSAGGAAGFTGSGVGASHETEKIDSVQTNMRPKTRGAVSLLFMAKMVLVKVAIPENRNRTRASDASV
jgi:hypothetical protein